MDFKITFLALSIVASSCHANADTTNHQLNRDSIATILHNFHNLQPIFFDGIEKPGIAVSGDIIFYKTPRRIKFCPDATNLFGIPRYELRLYDAHGNTLWSIKCSRKFDKTLKEIKAHCPSCIDTTHLKYVTDYTVRFTRFNLLFGKKWFGKKIKA